MSSIRSRVASFTNTSSNKTIHPQWISRRASQRPHHASNACPTPLHKRRTAHIHRPISIQSSPTSHALPKRARACAPIRVDVSHVRTPVASASASATPASFGVQLRDKHCFHAPLARPPHTHDGPVVCVDTVHFAGRASLRCPHVVHPCSSQYSTHVVLRVPLLEWGLRRSSGARVWRAPPTPRTHNSPSNGATPARRSLHPARARASAGLGRSRAPSPHGIAVRSSHHASVGAHTRKRACSSSSATRRRTRVSPQLPPNLTLFHTIAPTPLVACDVHHDSTRCRAGEDLHGILMCAHMSCTGAVDLSSCISSQLHIATTLHLQCATQPLSQSLSHTFNAPAHSSATQPPTQAPHHRHTRPPTDQSLRIPHVHHSTPPANTSARVHE